MAIAAKPKRQRVPDAQAAAFISGADKGDISRGATKIVTTLRFDPELLKRIDTAARKRGVSRTAYVMMAVSRAVEEGL